MKKYDDKEVLIRMGEIGNEVLEMVNITHEKAKEIYKDRTQKHFSYNDAVFTAIYNKLAQIELELESIKTYINNSPDLKYNIK